MLLVCATKDSTTDKREKPNANMQYQSFQLNKLMIHKVYTNINSLKEDE